MTKDVEIAGMMALDILLNDFHRPIINGKINRHNIEEEITIGILSGELKPMEQDFVEFVMDVVQEAVDKYNVKGKQNGNA